MKNSIFRAIGRKLLRWFGLHPDVGTLISGGFKLANPAAAPAPSENLGFASRVIASGMWNYCFFQFYRHFAGPYWVERQYNPNDPSFIPRAGSMLSVNMTHRTWMGFRGFDGEHFAIVDPAGSLSPIAGSYSLELAVTDENKVLLPTRGQMDVKQHLHHDLPLPVTTFRARGLKVRWINGAGADRIFSVIEYESEREVSLVLGIRPFNQEGAALIHSASYDAATGGITLNDVPEIRLLRTPDRVRFSNLEGGDAYFLPYESHQESCAYGIVTGTAVYRVQGRGSISFVARCGEVLVSDEQKKKERKLLRELAPGYAAVLDQSEPVESLNLLKRSKRPRDRAAGKKIFQTVTGPVSSELDKLAKQWEDHLTGGARFECARDTWNEAARVMKAYVVSLQKGDHVTPGVFTYHHFWFRDAAYMLHALSRWNFTKEARAVLRSYPDRQERSGFFKSHEGEWDSNGQAMWSLATFSRLTGDVEFLREVYPSIRKGAEWIVKKKKEGPGGRLLPPGFSAEHLGPADHYYWDNLWSIAGLREAARAADTLGLADEGVRYREEVRRYVEDLRMLSLRDRSRYQVINAAPDRPIDSGMIGSICVLYPLELEVFPENQVRNTVRKIISEYFSSGLFFHPIIHSGYNIYLSLQIGQCLLALGDVRGARNILKRAFKRRTDLWTYPEAIHPRTGGGVMGDGFHGWAFSEILLLLREFVLRQRGDTLEIFPGLRPRELYGKPIYFGPFPVDGTSVTIQGSLDRKGGEIKIDAPNVSAGGTARIRIFLTDLHPGRASVECAGGNASISRRSIWIENPGDSIHLRIKF